MRLAKVKSEFLFHCSVERRLSANTVAAYKQDLHQFGLYAGRRAFDQALCKETLQGFLSHMVVSKKLSAATARRRIACLRALSKFAHEHYGAEDPFLRWSPSIKRPKRLPRALAAAEVRDLVTQRPASAVERETVFGVLLLGATGLRVSEFCSMRACDVSHDGSSVFISGKGSKERVVFVGNAALQQELRTRKAGRMKVGASAAALFLNSRGGALQPQTFRRRLHGLSASSSLNKRITPHMLRHTAATLLIEGGMDIRLVQRLLGHASIATTEIYTHVSDVALKRAMLSADIVGGLMSR